MIRSSLAAKGIGLGLMVLGSIACGDKHPPKPPETPSASTDDAGDGSSATGEGDAGTGHGGHADSTPTTPPPAALPLPAAAAKLKFKVKKEIDLEIKSDGSVHSGGKPAGKVSGMELHDASGKTQLKIDADGTITTGEGAAYAKFDGDDLTSLTGAKYTIGDDGALTSTDDKGKKANLGKTEGVGSAKRTALLAAAFSMWGTKAPAPGAPKGEKKAGGKPGKK